MTQKFAPTLLAAHGLPNPLEGFQFGRPTNSESVLKIEEGALIIVDAFVSPSGDRVFKVYDQLSESYWFTKLGTLKFNATEKGVQVFELD